MFRVGVQAFNVLGWGSGFKCFGLGSRLLMFWVGVQAFNDLGWGSGFNILGWGSGF